MPSDSMLKGSSLEPGMIDPWRVKVGFRLWILGFPDTIASHESGAWKTFLTFNSLKPSLYSQRPASPWTARASLGVDQDLKATIQ